MSRTTELPTLCPKCNRDPVYDDRDFPFPSIRCCGVSISATSKAETVSSWNDYAYARLERMALEDMRHD